MKMSKCGGHNAAELFLIFRIRKAGFFLGIGQKSALNENSGLNNVFHEVDTLCFLFLPSAAGINSINKGTLKQPGQLFALFVIGMEYLGTAVALIGKEILMDTYQDLSFAIVDDSDTFLQIGHFLCGYGIPFCVYGGISSAGHPGGIAHKMQQIPKFHSNFQVISAFCFAGTGGCTSIDSSVARIDDNPVLRLSDFCGGEYGYPAADCQRTQDYTRSKKDHNHRIIRTVSFHSKYPAIPFSQPMRVLTGYEK